MSRLNIALAIAVLSGLMIALVVGHNQAGKVLSTNTYVSKLGKITKSPAFYKEEPVDAKAKCKDGAYSFSQSRSGTCSGHGGVEKWL